jgi:hypothetical protein
MSRVLWNVSGSSTTAWRPGRPIGGAPRGLDDKRAA